MSRLVVAAGYVFALGSAAVVSPPRLHALHALHGEQSSVGPLLDRYAAGDHDGAISALPRGDELTGFSKRFRKEAGDWVRTKGAPIAERNRLIAASFGLEVARAQRDVDWPPARSIVDWGCEELRKGVATEAERAWRLAAIALVEGARDFVGTLKHVDHAKDRFPTDRRFAFAEVVAKELIANQTEPAFGLPPSVTLGSTSPTNGAYSLGALVSRIAAFGTDPIVGPEAHLRAGRSRWALGQWAHALTHFGEAVTRARDDSYITHLAHLWTGRIHESKTKYDEAERAYRLALDARPRTQAASLSLAVRLFARGEHLEARETIDAAMTIAPRPDDPWRSYGYGDFRRWPEYKTKLREALVR